MNHAAIQTQPQTSNESPKKLRVVLHGVTQKNFKHSGLTVFVNLIRFFNPLYLGIFFLMWIAEAIRATVVERSLASGLGVAAKELFGLFNPAQSERALPLVIEPDSPMNANPQFLADLALKNRQELVALMDEYGGILFRGFNLEKTDDAAPVYRNLNLSPSQYWSKTGSDFRPKLDEYFHRDNRVNGTANVPHLFKRTAGKIVNGMGIAWGAPWRSARHFGYHAEAAYSNCPAGREAPFASHISWLCLAPAVTGGYTVISDCRRIMRRIRTGILKKEKYVGMWLAQKYKPTNEHNVPWSKSFVFLDPSTLNKKDVEDALCPLVVKHPRTQEQSFANHLVHDGFFLSHRYFADGTQLSELDHFHVWKAHVIETTYYKWQKGDLLILDNWLTAHSGSAFNSFFGSQREIRVATLQLNEN